MNDNKRKRKSGAENRRQKKARVKEEEQMKLQMRKFMSKSEHTTTSNAQEKNQQSSSSSSSTVETSGFPPQNTGEENILEDEEIADSLPLSVGTESSDQEENDGLISIADVIEGSSVEAEREVDLNVIECMAANRNVLLQQTTPPMSNQLEMGDDYSSDSDADEEDHENAEQVCVQGNSMLQNVNFKEHFKVSDARITIFPMNRNLRCSVNFPANLRNWY